MATTGATCLAGLAALLAWQVLGSAGQAAAAGPKPAPTDALELILRLGDLPLGYEVSDGTPEASIGGVRCERVDPANTQAKLDDFLTRNEPAGCLALYQRTYRVAGSGPEPLVVGTGAMRLASPEAAAAGLAVAPLLLSHALDDELPEEIAPAATVGDGTRLFHWRHGGLFSEGEETVTFLVWRSGPVDAAIFVTGGTPAADDRAAVALAQRQQARIERPTPVTYADFDDREVALENPGLKVPVYWLGKRFDPGRSLHALHLEETWSETSRSARAPRAGLIYTDRFGLDNAEAVQLTLYTHQQWRRLRRERAELPGSLLCGSSHSVKVPRGRAVVLNGYEPRRLVGGQGLPCRKGRPKLFVARVFLPDVIVVAQTMEYCSGCAGIGNGRYDSLRGMAAIARGLVQRERPTAR